MAQAALAHDALLPRAPGGNGAGAALAVLVHAGLAVALTVSVDWRTHAPEVVSAELWASVPQTAAPRPVEPPPTPPAPAPTPVPAPPPPQAAPQPSDADIATERRKQDTARKRAEAEAEAERQRAEAEKKKREQAEKNEKASREARAADERLAQQREENLRRMMGQAGGTANAGTGTAAQDAAPSASYIGRLRKSVRDQIFFPAQTTPDNAAAEVEVSAAPGGTIIARRLVKSSGHKDWDEAVLRALDKLGKLPAPGPGEAAQTRLQLVLRPKEE